MAATKKNQREKKMVKVQKDKRKNFFSQWLARIKGMGRKFWLVVILLVVILGAFLIINNTRNAQKKVQAAVQTATVEKGDLVAIVGSTGTVEANQTADLSWQTNGRIASIKVKLNDQVEKDEVLAELDPQSVSQSIISARADLVTAKKELENLLQSDTTAAEAYQALITAETDLVNARVKRNRWNYNGTNWARIYVLRDIFIQAEDDLHAAQQDYDATKNLVQNDPHRLEIEKKFEDATQARYRAWRNLTFALGKSYNSDVWPDFADYDAALAAVDDARREWERVKSGPNRDDIEAAQANVDAAQSAVSMAELTAPFAGTVTAVNSKTGDLVTSSFTSFRIDDLSRLLVQVEVTEVDINSIQVGQRAELTFDAILNKKYAGYVTEVSPVGVDTSGVVNFTVTVEMKDADTEVKPGMTAAVNIVVNEIKNVLIVPNRTVRLLGGKRVVYVLKNGTPTPVQIEIGASSEVNTQVLSGDIKVGDQIMLNPPFEMPTSGRQPAFVNK